MADRPSSGSTAWLLAVEGTMRSHFFRTGGRGSYKASEVVGIFLLSLFAGMIISGVAVAVDFLLNQVFG